MNKHEYRRPIVETLEIEPTEVLAVSQQSFGVSNGSATEAARSKQHFWGDIK